MLFNVSNLLISGTFPLEFPSLAGSAFFHVAVQFGNTEPGLAVTELAGTGSSRRTSRMDIYRAAFGTVFVSIWGAVLVVMFCGVQKVEKLGQAEADYDETVAWRSPIVSNDRLFLLYTTSKVFFSRYDQCPVSTWHPLSLSIHESHLLACIVA